MTRHILFPRNSSITFRKWSRLSHLHTSSENRVSFDQTSLFNYCPFSIPSSKPNFSKKLLHCVHGLSLSLSQLFLYSIQSSFFPLIFSWQVYLCSLLEDFFPRDAVSCPDWLVLCMCENSAYTITTDCSLSPPNMLRKYSVSARWINACTSFTL